MTAPANPERHPDDDERTQGWLDDPRAAPADWTERERRRAAALSLLDALLERVHEPSDSTHARDAARVARALESVESLESLEKAPSASPAPRQAQVELATPRSARTARPASRHSATLAFGVTLALIGAVAMVVLATPSAHATLRKAEQAMRREVDRRYAVLVRAKSGPDTTHAYEASLWVRGERRFVARHPAPLGDLWFGSNGQEFWFQPARGPLLVRDDPEFLRQWLEQSGAPLPILTVSAILRRADQDYDLRWLPDESLTEEPRPWKRVQAQRRRPGVLPLTIDLWVDPDSGVVRRAALKWAPDSVVPPLDEVIFDLRDEQPLAPDWYTPAAPRELRPGS